MPDQEKLICNCKDSQGKPDSSHHIQYKERNGDYVVECDKCGRFLKFKDPQPGIKPKPEVAPPKTSTEKITETISPSDVGEVDDNQ